MWPVGKKPRGSQQVWHKYRTSMAQGQSQQVWHKDSDDLCYLIDQIYEGRTNADSAKVGVLRIPIPVYTTAESWLLYVHNCMKHYWEHAKRLQKKEHGPSRVLEKLTKLFPTLIEDMYAGLAPALYADKVRHPRFMSREIVGGVIAA
ncbi:hypothetical protein EV1_019194 [Malus domestica]